MWGGGGEGGEGGGGGGGGGGMRSRRRRRRRVSYDWRRAAKRGRKKERGLSGWRTFKDNSEL